MNVMQFKGYSARIDFDDEDDIFFGRLAGIADGVSFHGTTVDELRTAFHAAVEDYLLICAEVGKQPQKSFSGKMMLRVDPVVHANAALAAELSGKSLNQWSEDVLAKAAEPVRPAGPRHAVRRRTKAA